MRVRVTGAAVVVTLLVLAAAAVAVVSLQRSSLTSGLDDTLRLRADDIVGLVEESLPPRLPQSATEGFAQVIGPDGTVIASTPNVAEGPPLVDTSGSARERLITMRGLSVDDDTFRVLMRRLDGAYVVVVGTTYDVVEEATSALVGAAAIVVPVAVLLLGAMVWWLVGATLRPVDTMTSEVGEIGASDLGRRVAEPGTRDEISRLARTLNAMLERVENALNRQQQFAADASHELRGPLTRIRTELDLALGTGDGVPRATLLSILDEVDELQAMLGNLLYLARLDASALPVEASVLDLDDVLLRESERIRLSHDVEVNIERLENVQVRGEPGALGRMIRNLLDNAARHASSGVSVELRDGHGGSSLTIKDDGPGVPEDKATQIFERFGRADQSRSPESGGAGLGLSIAREIAEQHGGSLVLDNPGQPGASFRVSLPTIE